MNRKGKLLSSFLIFILLMQIILPVVPLPMRFLLKRTNAAPIVDIRIARGAAGFLLTKNSVTLEWDRVTGANAYEISWMDLTGPTSVTVNASESATGVYTKLIDKLSADIVYMFDFKAFDSMGNVIATGNKKILTHITFASRRIQEVASNLPPDGKEVGVNPQLVLKWKIPQVVTGVGTTADYALAEGKVPTFRINIGTDRRAENKAALYVNYDEVSKQYYVTRGTPSGTIVTDEVYYDDADEFSEYMGFIVSSINNADITPGTIFYMTIEPIFDVSENIQFRISSIEGGYTYTPIRFQVTKDNFNNIIITIFKVNQSSRSSAEIASFTYEVQSDTSKNFYNYIVESRESDAYTPNEDNIVIFLGGKNINTAFFYRVAAYSSSADEGLMSSYVEYVLLEETNRAPMPEEVRIVDMQAITGDVGGVTTKSVKLKLRWKKPSNYNALKSERKTYYHLLINSAQYDMKNDDGITYKKEIINTNPDSSNPDYNAFDIKYREVFKVNIANSAIKQTPDGSSLELEIDGFNLFKSFDVMPDTGADVVPPQDLQNAEGYPNWLMANKIYYAKMYSSRELATVDKSDTCIPLSFTTPLDVSKNPPAPGGGAVSNNDINQFSGKNFIQLEWEKVSINLNDYTSQQGVTHKVYYDLYISDSLSEDGFVLAGTSQLPGDVLFTGHDSLGFDVVTADISRFSAATSLYDKFGDALKPNYTYYFKVKCRLSISGEPSDRESDFSNIVAVTTKRSSISEPDEQERKPLAITDFSVALDGQGNRLIDSNSVTLNWTQREADVKYTLIRTSKKIDANTTIEDIQFSPDYEYFEYVLPEQPDGTFLKFDAGMSKYSYFADDIFPNRLYYFSMRAERAIKKSTPEETVLVSMWTTAPVTTSIIEPPKYLEVISDGNIGIKWLANSQFRAEDFKVSISTQKSSDFRDLGVHEYAISQELTEAENISSFYVRVGGLKTNTDYYLKVEGTTVDNSGQTLNYPATAFGPKQTRDAFYEIEVRWMGKVNGCFKIAVKSETDTDYTELLDSDVYMVSEVDKDTAGTSSRRYYARIKSIKSQQLSSGTRYYVKVRSYAINDDTKLVYYSKYVDSVSTRTEFSQKDYDDVQEDIREETEFNRCIAQFRQQHAWKIYDSSSSYEIILRGAVVNPWIQDGDDTDYVIELGRADYTKTKSRGAYIPLETINILNTAGKNLVINVENAQFILKPGTVSVESLDEIKYYADNSGMDRVYVFIGINTPSTNKNTIPFGLSLVSDIYSTEFIAVRMEETEAEIERRINNHLDSLAVSYINILKDTDGYLKDTPKELRQLLDDITHRIDVSLTSYCRNLINEELHGVIQSTKTIKSLSKSLQHRLRYSQENGYNVAYSYNSSKKQWNKINSEQIRASREVVFSSTIPLECALLTRELPTNNVIVGHWAGNDVLALMNKIDFSDIYIDLNSIRLDDDMPIGEIVRLLEKVVRRKPDEYRNLDIKSMVESIGIKDIINPNVPLAHVTRQEVASLLVRVYCVRTGISEKAFSLSNRVMASDEKQILDKHFKAVMIAMDIGLMSKDSEGNFMPDKKVSRAELFVMVNRLIGMLE